MPFKKIFLGILAVFLVISGCGPKPDADAGKELAVSINDYKITREEFEREYKESPYGAVDTPDSRRIFLNALIDRKLILQYAQQEGLDKEKSFLKSIEKFWEQSLLKIALEKKSFEIASHNTASGWEARKAEDEKRMDEWTVELRKKAQVTIHDLALRDADDHEGSR